MRALLAAAVGVLLLALLLCGSTADLGATLQPASTALVLVACGAGLCLRGGTCAGSRRRDAALLGLLVLARGPFADGLLALLPAGRAVAEATGGSFGLPLVAAMTLVPPGLLLGRLLRAAATGACMLLLLGACGGVLLLRAGAAGWLPAWLGVPAAVAALWLLTRRDATCAPAEAPAEGSLAAAASKGVAAEAAALLLGAAVALVAVSFLRLVPAYVAPSAHPAGDVLLALLLPAAIVAWPASVLASGGWALRIVGALGGVLVAAAVWVTAGNLGLYENAIAQVTLTRQLHDYAARSGGLLLDWHAWLLSFAGYTAAALGVATGAFRGARVAGMLLLGAGLAQGAEHLLIATGSPLADDPLRAPLRLLLAAASCGLLMAPLLLGGRRGWLAALVCLPLAATPFLAWQPDEGPPWFSTTELRTIPGFDEVRRPGEYSVEAFQRALAADVTTYSTPGPDSHAIEGRQAYTTTLSPRRPVFWLGRGGEFRSMLLGEESHAAETAAGDEASGAEALTIDAEPASEPAAPGSFLGVRVAGRALHAQHAPLGPDGSVGRLLRLLAPEGRLLVCGIGAELLAADLHDAERAASTVVASAVPLGQRSLHLLLDELGSAGWQSADVGDPELVARSAAPADFACVVVAPAPEALPGTSALLTVESLERLAALLAPAGRCLAWVDTTDLDGRALRARCAAFGSVFGERSAAFVEPRELDPPFVLLVGWVSDAGRLTRAELEARLPSPDASGFRVPLTRVEDLAALLLRDGPGMVRAAEDWPRHARARPVDPIDGGETGWAAVAQVAEREALLERAVAGAGGATRASDAVFAGLARHSRLRYRLLDLNETLLEIKPDVDWEAFDAEAAEYARAAAADRQDPLLHLALAALLEQLAIVGDLSRFVRVYEACGGQDMHSWRLALQEAWVRRQALDDEGSEAALQRARKWAAGG